MKKCVFAGTFDPPTVGHEKTVEACAKIFDEVVVAVMVNPEKKPLLTADERVALLKKTFLKYKNQVKVYAFSGAAADILKKENTPFYVRGVRDCIDFEYENRNYYASKDICGDIVEIYIPAEQNMTHISSSLVRSCLHFEKEYLQYIPEAIRNDLLEFLKNK